MGGICLGKSKWTFAKILTDKINKNKVIRYGSKGENEREILRQKRSMMFRDMSNEEYRESCKDCKNSLFYEGE